MRFGCFVSHSPFIWLITKAESPYTCKNLILKSIAALIPMMHASYSAMLLVQLKHNLAVKGVCPPVGDVMMVPIPLPSAFEAPSKTMVHRDPDGPWSLMEPQTHLAMELAPSLHPLPAGTRLSLPDYVSVALTTWPNTKRASWVSKLL